MWTNIGSSNALLLDGTRSLPYPVVTMISMAPWHLTPISREVFKMLIRQIGSKLVFLITAKSLRWLWVKSSLSMRAHCHYPQKQDEGNAIKSASIFAVIYASCIWWRHQMETSSTLLALCAGKSLVTGEFPSQKPVTPNFDVIFDRRLKQRLSIKSWFETPSRSSRPHCNGVQVGINIRLCMM